MKIRTGLAAILLIIPVAWFVSGHRFTVNRAPDFRDAPRDISALETLSSDEFAKVGADSTPELPAPQAVDAGGDKEQADEFFKYLDSMYKSPESSPIDTGYSKSLAPVSESAVGETLYSLKIEEILNRYLYSDLKFKTANGAVIHLSGNKSSNCPGGAAKCDDKEKIFIILTSAGGESRFIRVMDVANYGIVMHGSKTVDINGEQFTIKVYVNPGSPENSRIEIKSGNNKVLESTLMNLSEIVASKGADVKLSRAYKLVYGNEVLAQGKSDAKFTDKRRVILMPFPVEMGAKSYLLESSDITPSGVTYPELDRTVGFKLVNGVLNIFRLK